MLISLVGLPGVGKSSIGRRLARRLDVSFVDADQRLEAEFGASIASYFERHGESAFRVAESSLLASLVKSSPSAVIATGGGVVLDPVNRERLRESTTCVYLHADPRSLVARIARRDTRPLFRGQDPARKLSELYLYRDPLYREAATIIIETARSSADATAALIEDRFRSAMASPGEH